MNYLHTHFSENAKQWWIMYRNSYAPRSGYKVVQLWKLPDTCGLNALYDVKLKYRTIYVYVSKSWLDWLTGIYWHFQRNTGYIVPSKSMLQLKNYHYWQCWNVTCWIVQNENNSSIRCLQEKPFDTKDIVRVVVFPANLLATVLTNKWYN